jgi:hypothetical protein
MRICVCARVVRCSSGFRAACCDGLTSAWLAPSTQCVCLLWPRLWLLCRVWRSLPSTVALMPGRPGGPLCSSQTICERLRWDRLLGFLLALVRSRLLVVCTVAASVRATPLMDPRLWLARVLVRLSCSLVLAAAFAMRATPLARVHGFHDAWQCMA